MREYSKLAQLCNSRAGTIWRARAAEWTSLVDSTLPFSESLTAAMPPAKGAKHFAVQGGCSKLLLDHLGLPKSSRIRVKVWAQLSEPVSYKIFLSGSLRISYASPEISLVQSASAQPRPCSGRGLLPMKLRTFFTRRCIWGDANKHADCAIP